MINGYISVNLSGVDLTAESAVTVGGSYQATIDAIATRKPIIVEGITNDDAALSPIAVYASVGESGITIKAIGFDLTITSADAITVVLPETPEEVPEETTEAKKTTKKSTK